MYWIEFLISAGLIIIAGMKLTTYADKLSDQLKLGKAWIGIMLLGFVTSLPEAITSIASVANLEAYDLAVGNLLGSNNFNPLLLVLMDIVHKGGSVTNRMQHNKSHSVSAWIAMIMTIIIGTEIYLYTQSDQVSLARLDSFVEVDPTSYIHFGPLTIGTILVALLYIGGVKVLADLSKTEEFSSGKNVDESLSQILTQLAFSAAIVVVGAIWLSKSADTIAMKTGLGGTFVGSILLAFVTSLPEMVVTLQALKMGSVDLAIGNIFGSNMANMFIVVICSLFVTGEPLLVVASNKHIVMALSSIIMTFVAMAGIASNRKKTYFGLGWDTIALLCIFFTSSAILYSLR